MEGVEASTQMHWASVVQTMDWASVVSRSRGRSHPVGSDTKIAPNPAIELGRTPPAHAEPNSASHFSCFSQSSCTPCRARYSSVATWWMAHVVHSSTWYALDSNTGSGKRREGRARLGDGGRDPRDGAFEVVLRHGIRHLAGR